MKKHILILTLLISNVFFAQKLIRGFEHNVVIKNNGTLWAWGNNSNGQIGDFTFTDKNVPTQIGTATDWKMVVAGAFNSMAIKNDGTLWAWGKNNQGQLGDGTVIDKTAPKQIGTTSNWKMVVAGTSHSMAIKNDGTLWAWGQNNQGQFGDGTATDKNIPTQIGTATDWKMVVAGTSHSMAIKNDGTLWAWGLNSSAQLGDGTSTNKKIPTQIGTAKDWKIVVAGETHTLAIKNDGTLWAWGSTLGLATDTNIEIPTQIGTAKDWKTVVAGTMHNLAIKNNGTLWAWGQNTKGEFGVGTMDNKSSLPIQVETSTDWKMIFAGGAHSMAIKNDGTVWTWGHNTSGQLGDGTFSNIIPNQIGKETDWNIIEAAEGGNTSLTIKNNGTLWTWGYNGFGQLGDGTTTNQSRRTQIGVSTDWKIVYATYNSSIAIKNNGTLWAWGDNSYGKLGDGTTENKTIPTQIGTSNDWKVILPKSNYTLAIKNNGSLWKWGGLPDGTNTNHKIITQIGTDTDWSIIVAGSTSSGGISTIGIKNNGTLWAWGDNTVGQLGDGTNISKTTPTQIGTATDWKMVVSDGASRFLAIKNNGTLWIWGNNTYELGGITNTTTPTQVGTDSDWKFITARFSNFAIKNNGTLWGWGSNLFYQLGIGTNQPYRINIPTQIGTATDWKSVTAGGSSTLALKNDGTLWAWGYNTYGQLGNEELYSPRKINFSIECVSPNVPDGNLLQSFNSGSTLSNIVVTGTNIQWYATATGGNPLTNTTPLVNGATYYASQTAGGCESLSRLGVTTTFFNLPFNNFTIETKSETCATKNNGQIIITASQTNNYFTTINGKNYNFVNNGLTVPDLAPGVYTFCIGVTGKTFEQCYSVTIGKGGSITGKSSVSSNKALVEITSGTAPFEIVVNGTSQFETSENNFSVDVKQGDLLEIKTSVACEGIYSTNILDGLIGVIIHPNPTAGLFEITIPTSKTEVEIELYSISSQLISKRKYPVINHRVQLSLEKEPNGIYFAKLNLDSPLSLTIIKKS